MKLVFLVQKQISEKRFQMAVSIRYLDGLSPSTAWSPIATLQAYPLCALSGSDSLKYSLNGSFSISTTSLHSLIIQSSNCFTALIKAIAVNESTFPLTQFISF